MQVVLVMFRSDGERRSFSVTRDVTVIGRRVDCDLRIPLSDVSRKHCRVIKDGDSVRVEDLGSSNGTYHNGLRVQEGVLSPGDTIQVGPVVFCIQIDGYPAEEEMAPIYLAPETAEGEALPDGSGEGQYETLEEPSAETEEESAGFAEEEQLETIEEDQPSAFEELPAADEEELETLEEVPMAVEPPASTPPPLPMSVPPPLPVASADDEALALEEIPAEEELTFVDEPEVTEEQTNSMEEDVIEDFEVLEEAPEEQADTKPKK